MLVVSQANSIRFAVQDSNLPNPENTLSHEEKYGGYVNKPYCQRFSSSGTQTIQMVSEIATEPTITIYNPSAQTPTTATLVSSYVTDADPLNWRYYFEYIVDFSSWENKTIYITAEQDGVTWKSENIISESLSEDLANGKLIKIEYGNADKPADYKNFLIDYTTGISFYFYVAAVLRNYEPNGEDEVFTNIDQKELIEAQLFIADVLQTEEIPKYLTKLIWMASKHYTFKINDLEYEAEGVPDIEDTQSNLKTLTYPVIQKNVYGFDTDDRGLTCTTNDMILTRKISDLTSTDSFVVPAGYLMHDFICGHEATSLADYTFKAGSTVGGDEFITAFIGDVPQTGGNISIPVHEQRVFSSDTTIYVEKVSGTGAKGKIWVQLLYNG